jgi:peptidyl-prolyl cis-trans isomerase D
MLQRIRDGLQGQKWLAWLILGAIGATFVFWGGSGSLDPGSVSNAAAAEVDGEEIPAELATREWNDVQANWAQQVGTEMPAEQREAMQQRLLDNLILRKLIEDRMDRQHFRVSEAAVLAAWRDNPNFQTDGKFDRTKAVMYLQSNGLTEREFQEQTRQELLTNQLQQGIGGSYFLTKAEQQRLFNLENEEREVQYLQLPAEKFAGNEPIDDAAVQAYYEKNGDRFMSNEYVSLDFAELRLEQLASQVIPTEADLRSLYDENRAQYVREESRRARHIVIAVAEGSEEGQEDPAALKKAESVAAEARSGKDFAELAKLHSSDPTANQGGELGFVQKQDFPGPIGDTLFSMKVGDVSAPVKSQFGYHILKLEEIQAQEVRPFEEVRAELDAQYRTMKSADLFGEREEQITTLLSKGNNEIDAIARDLGLARGTVEQFVRGGGGEPLGSGPELQQRVFSDATLNQGKIGGPVALGEDRLVIFKVREHHKASVKPLSEVREQIVALLRDERGEAAAKAAAEAALKRLQEGESIEAVAKSLGVTAEPTRFVGRGDPSIPADLRTAVFEAPRPVDKPVIQMETLDDGSSALFVVSRTRVADASSNPAMTAQQNVQLMQRMARGEVQAYIEEVKANAEIVKNPEVFAEP